MKYDVDQLLQQALSPEEEPGYRLNQKILQTAKETENMKRRTGKIPAAVLAAALTLALGTLGVFAGWKYLAPENVAEVVSDDRLSKAFQSEDAIVVNETQEYGGYKITLLGIVSGKELSKYPYWDDEGNIVDDRTYIVTAIENADGTPRPDVRDEDFGEEYFYVSPYIKGMSMLNYNAHTLGGGYSECVVDGIQYRILEFENVEILAKRGIYLGVSDGVFFDSEAYIMDEETGEITRNEAYEGLNALFKLPIPAFKGDEAAAEAYLESIREEIEGTDSKDESVAVPSGEAGEESWDQTEKVAEEVESWTLEDFEANTKCVFQKELIPDEKGYISYSYEVGDGGGSEATTLAEYIFEDGETGLSDNMTIFGDDPTYIETFEKNEDGSVTLRVFAY